MSVWLVDADFILCVRTQCYVIYFVAEIVPALPTGGSFTWLCAALMYPISVWFSEQVLTFWHKVQIGRAHV